jgi:hypothetical protein
MTLLESVNRRDDWAAWSKRVGVTVRPANRLEFGFSLLGYQAAVEGLGFAIAQPEFVQDELTGGRLIAPFPEVFSTGNLSAIATPCSGGDALSIVGAVRTARGADGRLTLTAQRTRGGSFTSVRRLVRLSKARVHRGRAPRPCITPAPRVPRPDAVVKPRSLAHSLSRRGNAEPVSSLPFG